MCCFLMSHSRFNTGSFAAMLLQSLVVQSDITFDSTLPHLPVKTQRVHTRLQL
jgi:hypothetical protein